MRRAGLGLDSAHFSCAEGRKSGIKSQTSNANSINYKCGISTEDLDGGIKVGVIGSRKEILCSRLSFKIKEKISPLTGRILHPEVFFHQNTGCGGQRFPGTAGVAVVFPT